MKKTIILLAGYPGTGKTYLCNKILAAKASFCVVSQDTIKEHIWDIHGYQNRTEKDQLIEVSRRIYYECLETTMKQGLSIISDYPFSNKQKPVFEALAKKYEYQVITIRLVGDLDILYERQSTRDLDGSRHLSHIMSHYTYGDILEDKTKADSLVDYDEFIKRCTTRGYGTFSLGKLFEVDVSDFSKVDYTTLIKEILQLVGYKR